MRVSLPVFSVLILIMETELLWKRSISASWFMYSSTNVHCSARSYSCLISFEACSLNGRLVTATRAVKSSSDFVLSRGSVMTRISSPRALLGGLAMILLCFEVNAKNSSVEQWARFIKSRPRRSPIRSSKIGFLRSR